MKHDAIDTLIEAWNAPARASPQKSYAKEQSYYGDPSRSVKFAREKVEYMDQIKALLCEWAGYYHDGYGTGYPKQSAFSVERVQNSNRSTETYRAIPADIVRLNDFIEKSLAPTFKRIVQMEYRDRRPQKTKAAVMDMSREVFSQRLRFAHEQLNHMMFGL